MGAVEIAQQKEKERGNADDSKHSTTTTTTMIKMTVLTKHNGAQTDIDEEQIRTSPEICRYMYTHLVIGNTLTALSRHQRKHFLYFEI